MLRASWGCGIENGGERIKDVMEVNVGKEQPCLEAECPCLC